MGRRRVYKTNAERQRAYRKRLKRSVHFQSKSHLWETPQALFDELDSEFGFTLDVCASPDNAKCEKFFTAKQNGLIQTWSGACWMNPPYGREIGFWVQKAFESSLQGATVVALVPARTDTTWWHSFVMPYAEIRYLRGRLKFGGHENSAPFPSAVVIFRQRTLGKQGVEDFPG